ncbi:MAG: sigma-70 family RNA polymerase sigma factor [Bernardetiaceae bacterium]|nr:sigma-70 family RNA polymerase sigma factor [Bernardetiaceae bacterium]
MNLTASWPSIDLSPVLLRHAEASPVYHNARQDVIDACQAGDRRAQYELYKLYAKAMLNVCVRITGNTAEAEDVLQEAFITVFRKINLYRGESAFGAWLKRIVVNTAINAVRRRRLVWEEMDEEADVAEAEATDPHELDLQVAQVRQAVQQLPDGFRTVFSLYALEGYDHQEIAEILGVSVSTSKTQYNRAKKRLLSLIKK